MNAVLQTFRGTVALTDACLVARAADSDPGREGVHAVGFPIDSPDRSGEGSQSALQQRKDRALATVFGPRIAVLVDAKLAERTQRHGSAVGEPHLHRTLPRRQQLAAKNRIATLKNPLHAINPGRLGFASHEQYLAGRVDCMDDTRCTEHEVDKPDEPKPRPVSVHLFRLPAGSHSNRSPQR